VTNWVDTHCHLHLSREDPAVLLQRASDAGVGWVVNPGTDLESSREAKHLAARFPDRVFATTGVHPHEARRWPEEAEGIAELASDAVAIGECGLDFYRNLSPRPAQLEAFRAQLELASAMRKPAIVHCRDAFEDAYEQLAAVGADRVVLHCWTGGRRWTRRFLDLDVMFSFAGPLTYPGGETVRLGAAEVPPERALVETDTPYLTPPPNRSEPNEPANVVTVGASLAEVWGMDVDAVAKITSANAERVFRSG
jgi:TatD DNase family protein